MIRVEEGAYANLVLRELLTGCGLAGRDRAFATELVYGATRMRRACDWLIDRFVDRPLEPVVRAVLRLGAYQLVFLHTPAHAGVSSMVDAAPERAKGLVNAVLRKVAADPSPRWPDPATRLSYPDWIIRRLAADLGVEAAEAALAQMNVAAEAVQRDDGYTQDPASQEVAARVGVATGDRVVDLCAAPGGKATAMAGAGADLVVATDSSPHRARLIAQNVERLDSRNVSVVVADGRHAPLRAASADRVLVDAPCSGLGVLRRRPDARWRIQPEDVDRLASIQRDLLAGAAGLLRPGGTLVYSVCTLTEAETIGVDDWLAETYPELQPGLPPGEPWINHGRGALLLPQAAGTDGMFLLALNLPAELGEESGTRAPLSGTGSPQPTGDTRRVAAMAPRLEAKVLTVSDGVVAGTRQDRSGAALVAALEAAGFTVDDHRVVSDGVESVAAALKEMATGFAGLIVTTGGTGFSPRDLTPEGTRAATDRPAPGLAEAMRLANPLGRLSRGDAGILGRSIVINTPGSTTGSVECLNAVIDVLPHALALLAGEPTYH